MLNEPELKVRVAEAAAALLDWIKIPRSGERRIIKLPSQVNSGSLSV